MRTIKAYSDRDIDLIANDIILLVMKYYPGMDVIQLASFMTFAGSHILYLATNEKEISVIASKCYSLLQNPPETLEEKKSLKEEKDEIPIEKEGEPT